MPKNTYTVIIKTISCCYILRILIQEYAEDFHAKNIANKIAGFCVGNGET